MKKVSSSRRHQLREKEKGENESRRCPNCGSEKYVLLYGGQCGRRCASCGKAYDCDDNWLKKSGWAEEKCE